LGQLLTDRFELRVYKPFVAMEGDFKVKNTPICHSCLGATLKTDRDMTLHKTKYRVNCHRAMRIIQMAPWLAGSFKNKKMIPGDPELKKHFFFLFF
jgi:hypothetical protein